MREIKFKAWHKDDKCVVSVNDLHKVEPLGFKGWSLNEIFEIDWLVYLQYTGLKDKNGTEIYEGDIVSDTLTTGVIEYSGSCFVASGLMPSGRHGWLIDLYNCEVIGNIYENPDLLK